MAASMVHQLVGYLVYPMADSKAILMADLTEHCSADCLVLHLADYLGYYSADSMEQSMVDK